MIIAVSALIGFAIGLVAGYMLATLGTTNQKAGVLSDKKDCGVETEGISQSVMEFPIRRHHRRRTIPVLQFG